MQPQALRSLLVFDLETTALSPHAGEILEVGAVRFDRHWRIEDQFSELAKPSRPISPRIRKLTGISDAMVAEAAPPIEVVQRFLAWAEPEASLFIAHNASFDMRHLNAALLDNHLQVPRIRVVDTLRWIRKYKLGLHDFKLETLLAYIGHVRPEAHRAIHDAQGLYAVLRHFLEGHTDPLDYLAKWAINTNPPRARSIFPDYDR